MKNIIFINQDVGPLSIDIINSFINKKFNVLLYTGKITKTYASLNKNVKIRKLIPYKRSYIFSRIFTWIVFYFQVIFFLIFDLKKESKLYLVTNPPILPFLSFFFKNKFYVHVFDVYPNVLLTLPFISKNSFIYKIFSFLNKKIYYKAKNIFVPSKNMAQMVEKYVDANKIIIHSWWSNTEFIKPIKRENNLFIKKYNLENKLVIMYSGNLGLSHDIEAILELALIYKNNKKIKFVIIGEGPKKSLVDDFYQKNRLDNLLVLPFQSKDVLPFSLTSSDISIVTLDKNASMSSIPSKTYYILSAGSALLTISDNKSELSEMVNYFKIGINYDNNNKNEIINFIDKCYNNKVFLKQLKKNSRNASKNFSIDNSQIFSDTINHHYENTSFK